MRSEIVIEALHTTNRFALCHLVFKAIRKLHNPSNRIQDTMNDAFQRIAGAEEQQVGAEYANAVENQQEQSAIDSQAGTPSAESIVEPVDPGNLTVIFPAESPESQSEIISLRDLAHRETSFPEIESTTVALPQNELNKLWRRSGGHCECTTNCHTLSHPCGVELKADQWHAHLVRSVKECGAYTGANSLALCLPCHHGVRTFGANLMRLGDY